MAARLRNVNDKCRSYSNSPYWKRMTPNGDVWNYDKLGLHYCIVPKVACTFWKRIMRFVSHDYPSDENIQSPSDIDRYFIHYEPTSNIRIFNTKDASKRKEIMNKAFMFARDPFTRLWSAYIDKFLLPDFWKAEKGIVLAENLNTKDGEQNCGSNVTFKDFLAAISDTKATDLNEHWRPIHLLCSPCHIQYAAIGRLENFADDTDFILHKFGVHLNQSSMKRDSVLEEIATLVRYNFDIKRMKHMSDKCFIELDVAKRLWKAFQYNGYIDRNSGFPVKEFQRKEFKSDPVGTFIEIAERQLANQTIDGKVQRRDILHQAYKDIPNELFDKIKAIYEYDFELFDYDPDLIK